MYGVLTARRAAALVSTELVIQTKPNQAKAMLEAHPELKALHLNDINVLSSSG